MRERSQTLMRRSEEAEARIVSLKGDHWIWNTSSACCSKECSFLESLRRSQSATVLSEEPVARIHSEKGLKAMQFTSAVCAVTMFEGLWAGSRTSQLREG